MQQLVAAVDVGTSSARAGIFDLRGALLGRHEHPIAMLRPDAVFAAHDSRDIWDAVGAAVRGALAKSGAAPAAVKGISFDATCSLVVRDGAGAQLSVGAGGDSRWDTIVWLDHRALAEADECTRTKHAVLDYVGGVMSPEMQTPKLMWLKRHLPGVWAKAGYFFDLADFLTWQASGSLARSQCTLTAKWTYLGHEAQGWRRDYLEGIGLADMLARGQLPERASPIARTLGPLTQRAAAHLGLTDACRVGVGLIDAHAGALADLGALAAKPDELERHMALIAGTSSCVMALSSVPRPAHGVWGPYYGAVLPGFWVNEGGQSVSGALLDYIIRSHGAGGEPDSAMHSRVVARAQELRAAEGPALAARLNVLPDFHGNRSPLADPHALGVVSGLTLDTSFDALCRLYWRTCVAIALGVRHILETLNESGFAIDSLHVSGGHTKNPLLMELYADATGCTVHEPLAEDAMLLGTAMVAATAAGLFASLPEACLAMHRGSRSRAPNAQARAGFDRDYQVFLAMHRHRREIDTLTSPARD